MRAEASRRLSKNSGVTAKLYFSCTASLGNWLKSHIPSSAAAGAIRAGDSSTPIVRARRRVGDIRPSITGRVLCPRGLHSRGRIRNRVRGVVGAAHKRTALHVAKPHRVALALEL